MLLGVEVQANGSSALQPNVPTIPGLTPLVTQSDGDTAYALFAIARSGLNLIELGGTGGGEYSLQLTVAGDGNRDGLVDGADSQLLIDALGSSVGDAAYTRNLDLNRDGSVNAVDVGILNSNLGFTANRPLVVTSTTVLTHTDLEASISLENLALDPEGDPLFYRVLNPVNRTVVLTLPEIALGCQIEIPVLTDPRGSGAMLADTISAIALSTRTDPSPRLGRATSTRTWLPIRRLMV